MKRFAVTLSTGTNHEPADVLNQSYVTWCQQVGIVPLLVPTLVADPVGYAESLGAEGLLLTGGNDIGEAVARDRLEDALLRAALARGWSVIGICRGLQFINQALGGSITRQVNGAAAGGPGHVRTVHQVRMQPGRIREVLGTDGWTVNSFHNHGVTVAMLAPQLDAFALSPDGLVEGLWHPRLRLMAVQWHPERPGSTAERDGQLFRQFMEGGFWPAATP